jgi:hypothetical protein
MVYDSTRQVSILFGGFSTANLEDTWQWDGQGCTQVADSGPIARNSHAMAFDTERERRPFCLEGRARQETTCLRGWGILGSSTAKIGLSKQTPDRALDVATQWPLAAQACGCSCLMVSQLRPGLGMAIGAGALGIKTARGGPEPAHAGFRAPPSPAVGGAWYSFSTMILPHDEGASDGYARFSR